MRRKKEVFWGVLFILGALFILVNKLGYFQDIGVITVVFTILLIGVLIDSFVQRSFGGILFSLAFLCILYDKPLGIEELTPWPVLFVALLGTIGLSMIFKSSKNKWKGGKFYGWDNEKYKEIIDEEGEDRVRCEVSFSSTTKYINSTNFKRADLEVSFGSMSVYFDNAIMEEGRAVVNLEVSFGSMELYIPKTWKVVTKLDNSFGGCKEHGNCDMSNEQNVLMINGEVSFGGLEIYYI